ncbi:MAG: hypothetical protein A3J74_07580 [Elusimicrobia bacterium RIFCSPHIGHO2_02_FULL_57_9]|nr:MAG: hypothetical protein A3J74_07580 [Elusimicrobia bacterium RIFCSPHIGHO2_02_FULL_57_9]
MKKSKVLIVDDDKITGGLTSELLEDAGFETELMVDGAGIMEMLKEKSFSIVILDILMPGVDGLTICRRIKTDPDLNSIKVVIVSGKSFELDKRHATQYGADLFIEKPYKVETFAQAIAEVASRREAASIKDLKPIPPSASPLQLSVWGCRSLGAGAAENSRYGRHTSCVAVDAGEHLLIFDGGSGLESLGEKIIREGKHKELWLFLTHFHKDHIEGLGKFACAYSQDYTLHIAGVREPDREFQDLLEEAFAQTLPEDKTVEAETSLYEMLEESYEVVPDTLITSFYTNHPGNTLGFVLEMKGRKLVYCPDSELYGEAATALQDYDEKLGKICAGADLLIHDGRYSDEDYAKFKNSGHSPFSSTVDLAGNNDVKRLLLFHHHDQYSDEKLDLIEQQAAGLVAEKNYFLQCTLAREGLEMGV